MSGECDLHEMANCALCNGSDARLKASLMDPEPETGPVEQHSGGVTIRARFDGRCANCGNGFPAGEPIFLARSGDVGWVKVDCCLRIAQDHAFK